MNKLDVVTGEAAKEVDQEVLSRPARYRVVRGPRQKANDPSPLQVPSTIRRTGRRRLRLWHATSRCERRRPPDCGYTRGRFGFRTRRLLP